MKNNYNKSAKAYMPYDVHVIDPKTVIYVKSERKYTITNREPVIVRTIPSEGQLTSFSYHNHRSQIETPNNNINSYQGV